MNTIFFSVCLPVYNGEKYIGKAVRSVIGQTFQDWELVIYNNGSTDSTSEVIRGFQDNRIRIIEERESVSKAIPAWHKSMSMARGTYVLMLGHDDWFKPDFLEVAHHHIEKHNLDVFSGWTDSYDPQYRFFEVAASASFIQSIPNAKREGELWLFDGKGYIEGFLRDFEQGFSKMHLSTTLMRRSLYEQVGGFNTELQYCAESELYLKFANAGAKFGFYWGRSLVNYIGIGEDRRAHYMPVNRKYHDFYRIPCILLEEGMVDESAYSAMIDSVNKDAVLQGFGYSLFNLFRNVHRYTPRSRRLLWYILAAFGAAWSRTRQIGNAVFRKMLHYAST
ncbi:MAG: hypothetical protein A2Y81_00975 [Nitrospirae bacterium RBG_13_43_8]|nr:MAG: hypothetical protein A2Y81_00975 [Nitrospirae bacterium RBG_13_43_8]